MAVITRSAHPDAYWPGVKLWFARSYEEQKPLWPMLFDKKDSKKHMEVTAEATHFGLPSVKSEGAYIAFDEAREGYKATYTHVAYALGWIITREARDDNQYDELARGYSRALAYSMRQGREFVAANIFNRAFNSSYLGGDGATLCSTAHQTRLGTQSNRLSVDADLSEASLEDACKIAFATKNARGLPITVNTKKLIVSNQDVFNANRFVNSALRSGTANNDLNAMKYLDMFPEGIMRYRYLTDDDAWFVTTDCPDSLIAFTRTEVEFDKDEDFGTMNARARAYERYSHGWSDFRGIIGSQGAG